MTIPSDPMEAIIFDALTDADIAFVCDGAGETRGLDFYLPDLGVHIEVKRFHSERISEQMSRADNVVALQGEAAVRLFAELLKASRP